jgi:hypothetical protein
MCRLTVAWLFSSVQLPLLGANRSAICCYLPPTVPLFAANDIHEKLPKGFSNNVAWGQNTLAGNGLGEKGGKGNLQGWQPGISFRNEDACAAWGEDKGEWLPGRIHNVRLDSITVLVEVNSAGPNALEACQTGSGRLEKLTVLPDAVRQPLSGDSSAPPWFDKQITEVNLNPELLLYPPLLGTKG